jgi:exosortase D (VPLPA-CTERM-specific)
MHHGAAQVTQAAGAAGVWPDAPGADSDAALPQRTLRLPLLAAALVLVAIYAPAAVSTLIDDWNDPNYSHGVLVPLVALLVAWQRHHDVHAMHLEAARRDGRWAWLVFLAGCGGFVLATAAAEAFAQRTSGVIVLAGLTGILGGSLAWRRYAPAVALVACAVPLPYVIFYRISVPLQLLSAQLASGSLTALGLDVMRSGNVFEVGGNALEVVGACSGIRSMMALTTLALTGGVWLRLRPLRGALLALLALPAAMAGNIVRLVITALLVLRMGPKAAEGTLHETVGAVGFAVSLGLLVLLVRVMQRGTDAAARPRRRRAHTNGLAWLRTLRVAAVRPAWVAVALLGMAGAYGAVLRAHAATPSRTAHVETVPLMLAGYAGEDLPLDEKTFAQVKPDAFLFRNYAHADGFNVGLYLAYYVNPREGAQIHSPMHCYPGGGWKVLGAEALQVRDLEGHPTRFQRLVARKGGREDVVVYWYETRTGRLTGDFGLKWNLMRTALLHQPQDMAFVRWSTPRAGGESVDQATERLLGTIATAWPSLQQGLPFGS